MKMVTGADRQTLIEEAEALQSESDLVNRRLHDAVTEPASSSKGQARSAPSGPPGTFLWFECTQARSSGLSHTSGSGNRR